MGKLETQDASSLLCNIEGWARHCLTCEHLPLDVTVSLDKFMQGTSNL